MNLKGLLDTGANLSVIGNNFHQIFLRDGFHIIENHTSVQTADGSPLAVIGSISLPVLCNNLTNLNNFLIIPSIKCDIILGMDFILMFKIFNNSLSLPDKSVTLVSSSNSINEVRSIIPREQLSNNQNIQLNKIINKFTGISFEKRGLGKTNLVTHKIVTSGAPIKQRHYPLSPVKLKALNNEVDKMLDLGVISPSRSPWSNPVVMVAKKDGSLRFCLDARKLNDVTIKDSYPIPYISSILDNLKGARYLTSLDLSSSYWQIPLKDDDDDDGNGTSCQKTAFVVPNRGLFEFKRMPFGLSNAGSELQRLVDRLFSHQFGERVFTYLDDLLIATDSFDDHVRVLTKVLDALKDAGLTINLDKCDFCKSELKYLGYIINSEGLKTDPQKLNCIENFPVPTSAKQLRGFIGLCSYYRRFVKNFSSIIAPMTSLLSKRKGKDQIEWNAEAQQAFESLKLALTTAPVLACPDFTHPFTLHCDASSVGIGSVLTQTFNNIEHPVAFHSRLLSKTERNYSTTERELLAVVDSINHFRPYLEGTRFTVITDHMSLKWLKSLSNPSGRLARWSMQISQYNFEVSHKKGKLNIVPDALSRASISLITYSNETRNTTDDWYLKVFDGCSTKPQNFKNFQINNNVLYRFCKPNNSLQESNSWKIVLPKEKAIACIKENHENFDSVHPGIFKTYNKIKQHYFWKDMYLDIVNFVGNCEKCKAYKPSNSPPQGLMTNPKVVSVPMHTLSIDIIGPLVKAYSGHNYILSIVDVFSKYCWLHPLKTATTKTVTSFIENYIIFKHGTPCILICDNATIFQSKNFKLFCKQYNIPKIFYNAYYSPQSNTVERYNQTVQICLSILVDKDQRNWSKFLSQTELSLNSTVNVATGYTPYFLLTGRDIITDGNFHSLKGDLPNCLDDLELGDRVKSATGLSQLADIFEKVTIALTEAYQKNANRYNLRRKQIYLNVDDTVWRRNFTQSNAAKYFSAKLAPKFVKCKVLNKLSDIVYELQDIESQSVGKYHIKDIIKFT